MGSTEVGTSFMEQVIFALPSLSCLCSYPPLRNYQVIPGQEPIVVLSLWSLLAALFGLGLAIGVVIAVRICGKCCKYFENFLIAGWPSLLLSIPIHSSEPDRFDTRYVFFTIVQMFRYRGLDPRKSWLSVGCLWHSFCLAVWCRTMEQPETGD